MSGNSSKKDVKKTPTTKGKETVKCSVCDKELRKDEMKKHWENKHKHLGSQPSWKHIATGTSQLNKYFGVLKKDQNEEEIIKDTADSPIDPGGDTIPPPDILENQEIEIASNTTQKRDIVTASDTLDNSESKRSRKVKSSESSDIKDFVQEKFNELKDHVDKKIEILAVKNESVKKKASEPLEKTDEDVANELTHCSNIFELEILFKSDYLLIKKEDEVLENIDGYFCSICFEGIKPDFTIQSNGAFRFDKIENTKLESEGAKQSREFLNLKRDVKRHLINKTHKQKSSLLRMKNKMDRERLNIQEKAGMNVFRERYEGIKQSKSRLCFEKDMLRAKLNDCHVGDTNHSHAFAKKIDDSTYNVIKDDMRKNMNKKLDSTQQKRLAGLMMDKMTPNKQTGQMHAVVIPVPENPLSQDFLKPMMLDVPTVPNLAAAGLAESAKNVFNDAGFGDDQLEGIGWDGEYVKKGVKGKLLDILDIEGMSFEEMDNWVSQVWEPAHQLELTTKDIKEDPHFSWFVELIQTLNDTTAILGIGKGLEQSMEAAKEVGEKFYKLCNLSDTRFSAYFEGSISNFIKRIETTIAALKKIIESTDKKVKDKAASLMKKICSKQFFLLILGILDIYRLLGSTSSLLQTVQQFPWDIPKKQAALLTQLNKMKTLKLSMNEESGELEEIDQSLWPKLGENVDAVLEDRFVSVQTALNPGKRMGRSKDDIPDSSSIMTTVENKLNSLVKNLVRHLEARLKAAPTPTVIEEAGRCLDLENILSVEKSSESDHEMDKSLKKLLRMAKYGEEENTKILKQYTIFKDRLKELVKDGGLYEEIVKMFSHFLFQTHVCHSECEKVERRDAVKGRVKDCPKKGSLLEPKVPNIWKLLHLFYKEPILYSGLQDFLHLYLRCVVKTHAEGVVESMGNYIEIHSEKRRGRMDILDIGKEALIHWNGPPTAKADRLGREALDRIFGRGRWHFVTLDNKLDSTVTKKWRAEEPGLPFF